MLEVSGSAQCRDILKIKYPKIRLVLLELSKLRRKHKDWHAKLGLRYLSRPVKLLFEIMPIAPQISRDAPPVLSKEVFCV